MHRVKDNAGREWELALNLGHQLKLYSLFKLDIRHQSIFEKIAEPDAFANIVGCVLESQLAAKAVTRDQFFEALGADEIDQLTDALIEEIADFFPQRQRQVVKTLLAKSTIHQKAMAEMVTKKASSPEMDQVMENALKKEQTKISKAMAKAGKPTAERSGKSQALPA